MRKFTDKLLSYSADTIIDALIAASGLASLGGTYQPKQPSGLIEFMKKRQENKNM